MPAPYATTARILAADADIPDGPVGSAAQWRKVLDARAFNYTSSTGALWWSKTLSVDTGGTNAVFAINVGAIWACALLDGSTNLYVKSDTGGEVLTIADLEGGAGTLSNSTWYYVYAWLNGSTLDYQISSTAPDATRTTKSGDALYHYLGCFRTTSAGAPIPCNMAGGRYVYCVGDVTAATLQVVTAGAAAAYASVPCSTLAPPHARIVTLKVVATNVIGGGLVTSSVTVQRFGAASTGTHDLYTGVTALQSAAAEMTVEVDSSQRAQYQVNGGANAPVADIYVFGFQE